MLKRHVEFHPATVPANPESPPLWCISCREGNLACDSSNPCQPCSRTGRNCIRAPESHASERAPGDQNHLGALFPADLNIDMTLTAGHEDDHSIGVDFAGGVESHHTYATGDVPQFYAPQHHRQPWQLDSSAALAPDTGFSNHASVSITMADQPFIDEQTDIFRFNSISRNGTAERRTLAHDSGMQEADLEHHPSAGDVATSLARDTVSTPSRSPSRTHTRPASEVSSVHASVSADNSDEPSSVTSLSSGFEAESRSSLQDFLAKDSQAVTGLLRIFFAQAHPYWPILHAPTFDPRNASELLLGSMAMLASCISGSSESRSIEKAVFEEMTIASSEVSLYCSVRFYLAVSRRCLSNSEPGSYALAAYIAGPCAMPCICFVPSGW